MVWILWWQSANVNKAMVNKDIKSLTRRATRSQTNIHNKLSFNRTNVPEARLEIVHHYQNTKFPDKVGALQKGKEKSHLKVTFTNYIISCKMAL